MERLLYSFSQGKLNRTRIILFTLEESLTMNSIEMAIVETGRAIFLEMLEGWLDWFNESVSHYFFIKSISDQYSKLL